MSLIRPAYSTRRVRNAKREVEKREREREKESKTKKVYNHDEKYRKGELGECREN